MPKSLYVDPDKMRAEGKITFKDIPINVYKKSVKEEVEEGNYTKEDLLRIYRDMSICREFEDMLNQIKTQAKYADVETTYPVRPICPWDRRPAQSARLICWEKRTSPSEATEATARFWQKVCPVSRSWMTKS